MKYIYRGFMIGIGLMVAHVVVGATVIATLWGTIEPVLKQTLSAYFH